ncbi:MAG TPA: BTAD domain-containing putative transcriptional regulator [Acidimicrobiia bacterium]|nr:BTAD domain-containing putative transcriptional regulator [Acidimicrobiia bacterium]
MDVAGPKRRALLTFLALHLDRPVGRDEIVEALWPRRQTGREESTLRVHISHLRDLLESDRSDEPKVVLTRGQAYLLSGHLVELDTSRFDDLTRKARSHLENHPDVSLELLDEALALWRGRPLQDVEYEEFAQDPIMSLEQARVDAIEDRAEALIAVGEDIAAVQDLEPLVRGDPSRERPTSLLMLALYRLGRQADALRAAARHSRHLSSQGLESSPRLGMLEERILNHDPTLLPADAVTPETIRPGRSIRGYELREEAGRGSIGVVYRAYQPAVGREVAMKVIHPDVSGTTEFVRRFAEEARVIASLEHPHIVPLHDFWREPNGAFLVMRWMDGGSLQDNLRSPWEPDAVARTFDQIASALGHAHSRGVVHRDVKPANVLFDSGENAYLCDFGLAAAGIETGAAGTDWARTVHPPYASPELARGEGPTVASDIFGLGVMLAEAAAGKSYPEAMTALHGSLWEVASIATAANPADRFPDIAAFRLSLAEAVGGLPSPAPRTTRRNPYKGLEPFDEVDAADFYGRDDVTDSLLGAVSSHGLVAVVGASGSGKSSVVRAGLIPALRDGAVTGSEEWFIVSMVPGTDPFEEFHIGLRSAAMGSTSDAPSGASQELGDAFARALDSPRSRAVLFIDQFEELFSAGMDGEIRERFLDNVVNLVQDPAHRVRVVATMRADFSDRPLGHARFGDLFAKSSYLLAPMRMEQVEDVIRGPAGRVGVQIEPGLISEIVRDIADAPAFLPLLQYILAELFERRTEDRLTVQAYRSLGGVEGVLERRAEATFSMLSDGAMAACRQLFLRMVHLGDHGEQTRRRLPLTEVSGLGNRPDVDEALQAFSAARLLTYDRDPVSRTPTVEVAHETVIDRWTRFRVWIDEARSDLLAHRRLSTAAETWIAAGEDPSYLLTGGPLATALSLEESGRVHFNTIETRYVNESKTTEDSVAAAEQERLEHEAELEQRSRRRLIIGISTAVVALLVGMLAIYALVQRQRADDLAAQQSRENAARELASAAVASLDSADIDLSLLLGIEAANLSLEVGEEVLPEVVEALHQALISPRSEVIAMGAGRPLGGNVLDYSSDGSALAVVADDGGAFIIDPIDGRELGRLPPIGAETVGIDFHSGGDRILTTHADAVREWDWRSARMTRELVPPAGTGVTSAIYSNDGSRVALGGDDGVVRVFDIVSEQIIAELEGGHDGAVTAIAFDESGDRLVSAGADVSLFVWDITTGEATTDIDLPFGEGAPGRLHVSWNPVVSSFFAPSGAFAITTEYGEMWLYQATGERVNSFGLGGNPSHAVAFSPLGSFMIAAGVDGVARIFGTWTGGEEAFALPSGGVPLRDAAFNPAKPLDFEVATVGVDGEVRIWRDLLGSELPARNFAYIAPSLAATPDGSRHAVVGRAFWYGRPDEWVPMAEVIDTASGETIRSHPSMESPLSGAPAMSEDGSLVAFAGPSGDIEIIEVDSGIRRRVPDSALFKALAFSPDGTILARAGYDGSIVLWEVDSVEFMGSLGGHGDRTPANSSEPDSTTWVEQVAFHPSEMVIASAGRDGTVRTWDPTTGEGETLGVFDYELFALTYGPDGSELVVADRTGEIHVVDSDSGKPLRTLEPVSGPPTKLVFSPDGDLLVGAGPGPVAHVWDMGSGRLVRGLRGSVYAPMGVAFVDESEVLVLSTEGVLRRYLLDADDLVALARSKVSRELTGRECDRYLHLACDG